MRSASSLKRRQPVREPRARFTIYSEGQNTEPEYFRALGATLKTTLIEIRIFPKAGAPDTIKKAAIETIKDIRKARARGGARDSFELADEVWVCFDRDEHPKVKETIDNCAGSGIKIAFSNPCFELWLILHLESYDRPLDRHDVQKHLENICPGYDRSNGKSAPCEKLLGHLASAEVRAEKMIVRRTEEDSEYEAPYTNVHLLTRAIADAASKAKGTKPS